MLQRQYTGPDTRKGPPLQGQAFRLVWRWGESNPRPVLFCQGFSGRSMRRIFSAPAILHTGGRSGPSRQKVPNTPTAEVFSSGPLNDARIRSESDSGLTDYSGCLGSESEVSAHRFGTYFFAESVNEITLRSRPASPGTTNIVETDHPRIELPINKLPIKRRRRCPGFRCGPCSARIRYNDDAGPMIPALPCLVPRACCRAGCRRQGAGRGPA